MRLALHAELTKLRTVAAPLWLLVGSIAATVASSAAAVSVISADDAADLTLIGVDLGQALVVIVAVLIISGEYSSGMMRTSLAAVPRRTTLFLSKMVVLTGIVAVAGTVAVLGAVLAGRLIQPAADGTTPRAMAGAVLYLVLIGLLSLGIATAVRDSAASLGVVLGLLYVVPIVSQTISDPDWRRLLEKLAPMTGGLGVTAAWAAAALLIGGLLLHARDS
ncbi:ABC transporter permease [Kribbella sp. NPDC005582]|uniref:ABC transporter permease n=1 Tax=Kribbella sp. NPDC005582 TaxID=3156893 RepID=UPI0033AA8DEE